MEARIQKCENSNGIRIPNSILKSMNIKINDILNIEQNDDKLIISTPKKKTSLADKFKEYKGKNLAKEFSWDESLEKEIW